MKTRIFLALSAFGFILYNLGDAANTLVLFLNNQLMPVHVIDCAGHAGEQIDFKHSCAAPADHLRILTDYIRIKHTIYSPGDLGLLFGSVLIGIATPIAAYFVIAHLMRHPRPQVGVK